MVKKLVVHTKQKEGFHISTLNKSKLNPKTLPSNDIHQLLMYTKIKISMYKKRFFYQEKPQKLMFSAILEIKYLNNKP